MFELFSFVVSSAFFDALTTEDAAVVVVEFVDELSCDFCRLELNGGALDGFGGAELGTGGGAGFLPRGESIVVITSCGKSGTSGAEPIAMSSSGTGGG